MMPSILELFQAAVCWILLIITGFFAGTLGGAWGQSNVENPVLKFGRGAD